MADNDNFNLIFRLNALEKVERGKVEREELPLELNDKWKVFRGFIKER